MANAQTFASNTWTSEYFAEQFLTPAIVTDGLFAGAGYRIDPLVNKSKTIYTNSAMEYITQKDSTCGWTPSGTSELSEVELETQQLKVNVEQCSAVFFDSVFSSVLPKGTNINDLTGTVIEEYIVENYKRAMTNDSFVLAWFGDTSLGGTAFLDQVSGWFTRFEADATVQKYAIGSTGNWALEALRTIYDDVNSAIIEQDDTSAFNVTRNVYQNLLATYEQLGTDVGLTRLNDGFDLMFRGIPVIKQNIWDKAITDFSLSSSKRIVYAPLGNLMVGTNIVDPGSDARAWFDEQDELFKFKSKYALGVNYAFGNMIAYARN